MLKLWAFVVVYIVANSHQWGLLTTKQQQNLTQMVTQSARINETASLDPIVAASTSLSNVAIPVPLAGYQPLTLPVKGAIAIDQTTGTVLFEMCIRDRSRFSLKRLSRAYVQILRRQPQLPQASRTQPISLESINRSLLTSLNIHELQLPLTQPPDHWPEAPLRVLNIITFAAALELNRQNTLIVIQTESFGPITLRLAP